jgi:predicted DNA-binding WGR domain protein
MLTVIRLRDPGARMARFHALMLQTALPLVCKTGANYSEPIHLVHEWGRIGCPGRVMVDGFATEDEARKAADRLLRIKRRKGYR